MKNVNILSNICVNISNDSSIVSTLPWDDISELVLTALYVRKSLYPASQYNLLEQTLSRCMIEAQKAATCHDTGSVLDNLNAILYILEAIPDTDFIGHFLEEANFSKACLDHLRRNTVVFIGDSHVNFFSGNEELTYMPIGHDINICPNVTGLKTTSLHLGACLAYTVNKIDSSTGFLNKLNYLFDNFIVPGSTIIFTLGESDVRAHIGKQALLQNCSAFKVIDDIMVEYSKQLLHCKQLGYRVCVWGPIASQPDSYPLNPQFPRVGSELERNSYAMYFTDCLAAFCLKENIPFISILEEMLDENGRTKSEMLTTDQVHLSQCVFPLAKQKLNQAGIQI